MKINSIYISSFGGIKDKRLDFADGFNLIYGDNENGKSTVMAFIKMMFYGSERASVQISKNIRKKYTPWDNSLMAGSIDFEHGGKKYRLEKEFHASNSGDKTVLCDLDFGTRQAVKSDIGTEFFGLSAAAFERSVFIGRFGYPESDSAAEGEINSKLSNIVLTGDETVSFDTVNTRLEKARLALMSKSGKAGEYDKNLRRLTELKEKAERITALKAEYEKKVKEIALSTEKAQIMQKRALELKSKIAAEQDLKNAGKLKEYLRLKEDLEAVKADLKLSDGSFADDLYIGKLQFCISKAQAAQNKTDAKAQEINALQKSLDMGSNPDATKEDAERIQSEITALETKKADCEKRLSDLKAEKLPDGGEKKGGAQKLLFIIAIILLTAATAAGFFELNPELNYLPFITAAADAATVIAFAALTLSGRKKAKIAAEKAEYANSQIARLEAEIKEAQESVFYKKANLEAINTALNGSAALLARQREMILEGTGRLNDLKRERDEALATLLELFSRYRHAETLDEIAGFIKELSVKAARQKEIKNELNFIARDIGSISYDEARQKLDEIAAKAETAEAVDFDKLKAEYTSLTESLTELKSANAAANVRLNAALTSVEALPALESEIKTLCEKIKRQKEFCDAADIAINILRDSFAEVRRGYGSLLEKKAGEIFALLTSGKYDSMSISKAFDIAVGETDSFGGREIDYLSSGTADQAYLSLRLALSELICGEKEPLPVLLDDSLAQYDDDRMYTAVKYLKTHSENSQIIMFTCHKAISAAASSSGANLMTIQNRPLGKGNFSIAEI